MSTEPGSDSTVTKVLWDRDAAPKRSLARRGNAQEVLRARAVMELTVTCGFAHAVASKTSAASLVIAPDPATVVAAIASPDRIALTMRAARGSLESCRGTLGQLAPELPPASVRQAVAVVGRSIAAQLHLLHSGVTVTQHDGSTATYRVAHGDVAPGNVLIDAAGHVHLADFGCARWIVEQGGAAADADAVPELLRFTDGGFTPHVADPRLLADGCGCEPEEPTCEMCAPFRIKRIPVAPDGTCDTYALIATLLWWAGDALRAGNDAEFAQLLEQLLAKKVHATELEVIFREHASPAGEEVLVAIGTRVGCCPVAALDADSD